MKDKETHTHYFLQENTMPISQDRTNQFTTYAGRTPRLAYAYATGVERAAIGSTGRSNEDVRPNSTAESRMSDVPKRNTSLRLGEVLNCGTWNVRTLKETGKLHLLLSEAGRVNCDILGVAEIRWAGRGHFESNDHTIYYSGSDRGGYRGVGIILTKKIAKSVMGYNPVNERIISVRIMAIPVPITIIQVYAPTADAEEDAIVSFYESVQNVIDITPSSDILILMGDLNAKVGSAQLSNVAMGTYGLGEANEAGRRLVDFCEYNNLVITNTLFNHHYRRRYTWQSNDGTTKNQIDYIMIKRRWRSSVLNCRTYPGADADSDHNLVMGKIRLRIKRLQNQTPSVRYDVDKISSEYSVEIHNQFDILSTIAEEKTPNEYWKEIKNAVLTTADKYIPRTKRKKPKDWITANTLELVEKRRQTLLAHGRQSEEYKAIRRRVKKSCREDKSAHVHAQCKLLENQAQYGSAKSLFSIVKQLNRKFTPKMGAIAAEDGTILTDNQAIKDRWLQYTKRLYEAEEDEQQINWDTITKEPLPLKSEVERALKKIRGNKTCGNDNIPIELLRTTGETDVTVLHRLLCLIWETGEWPEDWCNAIYIPIPKKGNLQLCENYRTIALISHASKILLCIISERIKQKMNEEISEEQAGFRSGRGTRDQLVNLRMILEKRRDMNITTHLCFIDYKKAFDCVNFKKLFRTMIDMGFPEHLVGLIETLYKEQRSAVKTPNGTTDWFHNGRGVRQGCILSPQLFNVYTEIILRIALREGEGINIGGRRISNLRYADDTVLLADSQPELQDLLDRVRQVSEQYGLLLNVKKTKIMISGKQTALANIRCDGDRLEQVSQYTYLGAEIHENAESEKDIRKRLAMARTTLQSMTHIWKDRGISKTTKLRLLKALIWSIALYGCEGWTIKKADARRIEAFELWCHRRLLRISYKEHRTNEWVLNKMGVERMLMPEVIKRKLNYFGHILRQDDTLERNNLLGTVPGRRSKGRPRTSWFHNIKEWLGCTITEAARRAEDRTRWRRSVADARLGYRI